MPVRAVVTGDRYWECRDVADEVVGRLCRRHGYGVTLVHGHCPTGVDRAFDEAGRWFAETVDDRVRVERHPADWDALGRKAGPVRNQGMVDAGADFCIALHPHLGKRSGRGGFIRCRLADASVVLYDIGAVGE
jgi:hypothetical protein